MVVLETEEFLRNYNSLNNEKCWVLYPGPLNTWNLDTPAKEKEWISQDSWKVILGIRACPVCLYEAHYKRERSGQLMLLYNSAA